MKKFNFIFFVLICIIVVSVILFCKAVYEDEDASFDILCNANDLQLYAELFISILLCSGIFYVDGIISFAPQSVIAYLARHEKSPPENLSIC